MTTSINPEIQRNLYELGQVTVDFLTRMTQLTNAGLQSTGNRVCQTGVQYGESTLKKWASLTESKSIKEVGDLQRKWLLEHQDAYMDTLCNSQQVALLTQDEIQYWGQRLVEGWLSLAGSVYGTTRTV